MKNFSFFRVFLLVAFFSIEVATQSWFPQHANGLPSSLNPLMTLSAVDSNICWGVNYENSQFIRTTDGGDNWLVSNITGATGLYGSCISALDANTAWAAMGDPSGTTSGGIFKTTDGGNIWNKQTSAFQGSGGYPADVHFFDSNNGVAIGEPNSGNWEIYTTTNGGTQWTQVDSANIPPPAVNEFTGTGLYSSVNDTIWFGTFGNSFAIYRSTDRGYTWTRSTDAGTISFCVAFKDGSNGLSSNCFGGLGNRIAKTTDGGSNWDSLSGIPAAPSTYFISYSNDPQVGYVVTSNNNIGLPEPTFPGSMRSTDGSNWIQIDNLPHGPASFASDGSGWSGGLGDIIYKWIPPTVPVELVSFNSSVVWNSIQLTWQTATETNNQGFEIYRNGNKIAFVEGKGTTSEKQDYSFVDKNLQSGIYNYRLNQIDFDGTQEVVGELTVYLSLPEQFSLEQNYPNPFNPSTTIRYSIPTSEFVKLNVYDVQGNEVTTLVNEEKPAGSYEVEFSAKGGSASGGNSNSLSSGIYLYTLQAGRYTQTKKLILMK